MERERDDDDERDSFLDRRSAGSLFLQRCGRQASGSRITLQASGDDRRRGSPLHLLPTHPPLPHYCSVLPLASCVSSVHLLAIYVNGLSFAETSG